MLQIWKDFNTEVQTHLLDSSIATLYRNCFDDRLVDSHKFQAIREEMARKAEDHIPILKRPLIDTYEDRVSNLKGRKLEAR
jgi:hypothetical protein